MVNEERMKKTFTDLVKIYAPSKGERDVAEYLKKELKKLGAAKVIEDNNGSVNGGNTGNIIAKFNGNAPGLPSIAFTAHMDCVENCKGIEPVLEDGIFHSKGSTILGGDDKAGVTAILEGLHLMKEMYIPHGKITVIFTVQEEIGLYGSKFIEEKYINDIDFGYTLDADGPAGSLFNAGPSEYLIDVTCKGVAAHAGICPEKGTSAIRMAALGIAACPQGRIDFETTCNLGTIEGGTATNIVPDSCVVHGEARSRNEEKLEKVVAEMEKAFKKAAEGFPEGSLEFHKEKAYDAFNVKETDPCLRLFKGACDAAGFKMSVAASGGGSDANWFGTKGFPAVLAGVGMKDFHTNKENLALKDLFEAGELVYRIIEAESHFGH
ncbi:M20/M25/M40 family metallo-hydrolase [Dialister sp.]|uniref:M20/M25/M40 family metallo-hydrolase n=1 Tax=Dialister sp. TaxID=1955814 RepID=UPI002E818A57|nr:M20/M25/M40 family metallo-hydrolase [Dialister sp.]MEE3453610.1 M20/M25/M40 family metallo-hydrolase [Dialister sp.]